ncbi:MAG: serine/threonine protein kinase [Pirellulaceae bacterium]
MTDAREPAPEPAVSPVTAADEEQLAKQLEQAHEQLLGKPSAPDDSADTYGNDPLAGARNVLSLIQRVRDGQTEAGQETPMANPDASAATTVIAPEGMTPVAEEVDRDLQFVINADTTRLGRFHVLDRLGQGGYGLVFRGYDPELERPVALKIPRPESLFTANLRARFVREARTAAALSHPHIVTIYETGHQGSVLFLVCEYIEGETLADWLKRNGKPIDAEPAARLAAVLADALQHAHSRGVLHRDIKPANILLKREASSDDQSLRPAQLADAALITDFGLAKFDDDDTSQTKTGSVLGTPAYMAPEQTFSGREEISQPADIYALGSVLYELLTGNPPFSGSSVIDIIQAVQNEEPRPLTAHVSNVPVDLQAICLKCLEKHPARRYASAHALQTDLNRFVSGEPVTARPVTNRDRMIRWAGRNRGLAAALGALALMILIALPTFTALWLRSEFLRHQSDTRGELAANLRKESDSRGELAARRFEDLENAIDATYGSINRMPEIDNPELASIRAELLANVNRYYGEMVQAAPADIGLQRKRVDSLFKLVALKNRLGDRPGAVENVESLIQMLPHTAGDNPADVRQRVDALLLASRTHFGNGDHETGESRHQEAVNLARKQFAANSANDDSRRIELAQSLSRAAQIATETGLRTIANDLALESIEIWQDVDQPSLDEPAQVAFAKSLLIALEAYKRAEKRELALPISKAAIDMYENVLAGETRELPDIQLDLAKVHYLTAYLNIDTPEACNLHLLTVHNTLNDLIERHPTIVKYHCLSLAADYYAGLTQYIAARDAVEPKKFWRIAQTQFEENVDRAEQLCQRFPDGQQEILAAVNSSLIVHGMACGALEEYEKQLASLQRALNLNEQLYERTGTQANYISVLNSHATIGAYHLDREEYVQAIEKLELTTSEYLKILESDPQAGVVQRFLSSDCDNLASAYAAVDRHEEALKMYELSMQHMTYMSVLKLQGEQAAYLTRVGRVYDADSAFREFVEYQDSEQLYRDIVVHGSALISAIDEFAIDHPEAADLREFAVDSAIKALRTIDTTSRDDCEQLLERESLEPLRTTHQFEQWQAGR